ncbi:MAG: alkaline phosphatase [Planctomycetota bacterium]
MSEARTAGRRIETCWRCWLIPAVVSFCSTIATAEPAPPPPSEAPQKESAGHRLRKVNAADPIRQMQSDAETTGRAAWGHWGDQPEKYAAWSNHSNRLIPVYTFGMTLEAVSGANSPYRDADRIASLYGREPDGTLNPTADYFDQTDIYRLQKMAAEAGKKYIVLMVFDGLDWQTTRTAAIAVGSAASTEGGRVYDSGRGRGFAFQDYRGVATDFGLCVTSPANDGTKVDVDAQAVRNPGGNTRGGYDAKRGGETAWQNPAELRYLIGRDRSRADAITDSAASATSLCTGRKTYNDAINVDVQGESLEPIARTLQRRGYAVGAVSSVPVSHATPACAYANNVSRDDYQDIARDQLGQPSIAHRNPPLQGLDVLIGGGAGVLGKGESDQGKNFEPGNKYVADSTLAAIDAASGGLYRTALRTAGRRGDELLALAASDAVARKLRLFGFFGTLDGHLPYQTANGDFDPVGDRSAEKEVDVLKRKYGPITPYTQADLDENPTLADMTRAALEVLDSRGKFWLMVEAGDVDWASHANNIDTAIGAVKSGDDAFQAIVTWIERRDAWDDTALIVTSDHGHLFVLTDPTAFIGASSLDK